MSDPDEGRHLTDLERALVDHVERGELLDLTGDEVADDAAVRSWDDAPTVRAWVVRDILRGRLAAEPDPRGLRLHGARIDGRLDLDHVDSAVGLELFDCLLAKGLAARHARLPILDLERCRLEHPTEPALDLEFVTTMLAMEQAVVVGHSIRGAVALSGGQLELLNCAGASMQNASGPALNLERARVDHSVRLDELTAQGTGESGAVRLHGSHIGGQLSCAGASVDNQSGPALLADGLRVGEDVSLVDFEAVGVGEGGTIRLSAHIGGQLQCDGARWRNDSGPALMADGLQVGDTVFMRAGFTAYGAGEGGAIWLRGARIGGQLNCKGANLHCDTGTALVADSLQVDQNVFLSNGFTAHGAGELGAVRLPSARIGRQLDCSGANLRNDTGTALHAEGLRVDRDVFLTDGFAAVGGGYGVAVDLADAQVGMLELDPAGLVHDTEPRARLDVDGLVYTGVPQGVTSDEWLTLLREGTRDYAAQPYQQLAAAHRAAGHEREARRVLMAQRRDQINRHALTGRFERAWARLTGLTLGYGYQPWRALFGLLGTVLTAVVLAVVLGAHGGLAGCTLVERIGVGLDAGTPLITTGATGRCVPTDAPAGQILTVAGWVLRLLAWAFATLFVAGFTNAVRKT